VRVCFYLTAVTGTLSTIPIGTTAARAPRYVERECVYFTAVARGTLFRYPVLRQRPPREIHKLYIDLCKRSRLFDMFT
jgi:hypothetical protein